MARTDKKKQLIEFKGTTLPVISVTLRSLRPKSLAETAVKLLGKDAFFDGDAAILELDSLAKEAEAPDWAGICSVFSCHGLRIIGVCGGTEALRASATAAGLPGLAAFKRSAEIKRSSPDAEPAAPLAAPSLVIDRPLRSGQQIYARNGDLVILAAVSAGAEVIADGSIHVYAPLRGRALSGAGGATDARIFTTRFEAELVSVAGVYRTFEDGIPEALAGKPAQVRLHVSDEGDELGVEALKII